MTDAAPGLFIGDRVVVRYLLGDATPADWRGDPRAARSDVTGILVAAGDPRTGEPLQLDRDGVTESIPHDAITSIRLLSAKPVRNSEIRAVEHAAALAWPGVESAWIDGWLVRAGGGFTRRANCALPLEPSARSATSLPRIAEWYRRRDLPMLLALPDRLITPGAFSGIPGVEVQFLTADLQTLSGPASSGSVSSGAVPDIRLDDAPSAAWLRAYGGDRSDERPGIDVEPAAAVIGAARGPLTFATIGTDEVIATGRAAVTEGPDGVRRLGLTALWTQAAHRRRGLSAAILDRLVAWGAQQGATSAYVQVETTNQVAGAWYRRRGFGLHHTMRYLTVPSNPAPSSKAP